MQLLGAGKEAGLLYQPCEERKTLLPHPLRVPLNTEKRLALGALHGLGHAVCRGRGEPKPIARAADGLVVEGVDKEPVGPVEVVQERCRVDMHRVGGVMARRILRMSHQRGRLCGENPTKKGGRELAACVLGECLFDVLSHLSAQCHGQCLHATADAQHRDLPVIGQSGEEKFGQIALRIDAVQFGRRFCSAPKRIIIGSAREHQCIKSFERAEKNSRVGNGWKEHGCAPGIHNLAVIPVEKQGPTVVVVGRQTDQRPIVGRRISGVNLVEMRL